MKKSLIIVGIFLTVLLIGTTAYAKPIKKAAKGIVQVIVTNWPENQNVTVTNSDPIQVEEIGGQTQEVDYKLVTIGSKGVYVNNKISLGEAQERVLYASYEGKGKMIYATVVGAKGVGIQIETDGEIVAWGDAYDICTIFDAPGVGNGWKCLIKDWETERHGALEINNEYLFDEEIKIYLYRVTQDTSISGAHIELLVEE